MTPRQRRFVEEYLLDLNATQAAIRAGYSERSARSIGPKLAGNPHVKAAIEKAMQARSERTRVNADRVIEELAHLAFSDLRRVAAWGPDGLSAKNSEGLSEDSARAVAEVTDSRSRSGGTVKVKLFDKKAALELLGRHLGLFTDRGGAKANKKTDLVERLVKGRARAAASAKTRGKPADDVRSG